MHTIPPFWKVKGTNLGAILGKELHKQGTSPIWRHLRDGSHIQIFQGNHLLPFTCCRYPDWKFFRLPPFWWAPMQWGPALSCISTTLKGSPKNSRGHNYAIYLFSNKCNWRALPHCFSFQSWHLQIYSSRSIFPLSVSAHTSVLRGSKFHHSFLRQCPCWVRASR